MIKQIFCRHKNVGYVFSENVSLPELAKGRRKLSLYCLRCRKELGTCTIQMPKALAYDTGFRAGYNAAMLDIQEAANPQKYLIVDEK